MTTIKYKSKDEESVAQQLNDVGVPIEYEASDLEYVVCKKYKPDFKLPDGSFLEVKGYFSSSDRGKHILVRVHNPSVKIRFMFLKDNKLNKKSSTRYSDWARKNGFDYVVGKNIPAEWLKKVE